MKTVVFCLTLLVAVLTVIALPLTVANDTALRGLSGGRLDKDNAIRLAQADTKLAQADSKKGDPKKESARNRAARSKTSDRIENAKRKSTAKKASSAKSKRAVPVTAEMEAEVKIFVGEHHRELLDVLAHLQENLPEEYERAVRDLNRTRLRLRQFQGRDRYDSELALWKAQSRTRLLGARAQMDDDVALREALREKLSEVYDLRATILQRDRDRAAERVRKLDSQLEALRNDRDQNLEKQLAELTNPAKKRNKAVKTSAQNASPTPRKKASVKKSSSKTND